MMRRRYNSTHARRESCLPRCAHPAFTLVEMIVVVAIILVILGIALPALTTMWDGRKVSEAQNTIQGLLMTTRAKALQSVSGIDSGILFFIDAEGVQRIVSIERANPGDLVWENVFRITPARDYSLPAPMRVVPRYVVEDGSPNTPYTFSSAELANNNFADPPDDSDIGQRHRNFFTIVYRSSDGRLISQRDVLIQDVDAEPDSVGDIAGVHVGVDANNADVAQYWPQDGNPLNLDPIPPFSRTVPTLLADNRTNHRGVALNFPSVDGLLVYNDSLFNEAGTPDQKRDFLLRTAQPFYVNRLTGAVIRGPVGETP